MCRRRFPVRLAQATRGDVKGKLQSHEVYKLLTSIDGVGPRAGAYLLAESGDPTRAYERDQSAQTQET
jgi:transposase